MHKNHTVLLLSVLVVFLGLYAVIISGQYVKAVHDLRAERATVSAVSPLPAASTSAQDAQDAQTVANDSDMSAPDGGSISNYPNDYFLIPELKIGFKKNPQLNLTYTLKGDTLTFSSKDMQSVALRDPNLADCTDFGPLTISSVKGVVFGGGQIAIGDGRYIDYVGQQEPCYNPDKTSDADAQIYRDQQTLFSAFLNSVRPY